MVFVNLIVNVVLYLLSFFNYDQELFGFQYHSHHHHIADLDAHLLYFSADANDQLNS